jgi:hypothetical protein
MELNPDVWSVIAGYLRWIDVYNMEKTNKAFKKIAMKIFEPMDRLLYDCDIEDVINAIREKCDIDFIISCDSDMTKIGRHGVYSEWNDEDYIGDIMRLNDRLINEFSEKNIRVSYNLLIMMTGCKYIAIRYMTKLIRWNDIDNVWFHVRLIYEDFDISDAYRRNNLINWLRDILIESLPHRHFWRQELVTKIDSQV